MEPSSALLRYLYIGNNVPYYISKNKPIAPDDGDKYLECVKTMANGADPNAVLNLIKKTLQSKSLCRNDEAVFALAYCAKKITDNEKFKTLVYEHVPEVIPSYKDLFLFVDFFVKLNDGKTSFGHGMKKAITKWYDKHTAMELAEMFGKNRKYHGWSHKDIFHMIHIKLENAEKQEIIDAAMIRGARHIKVQDQKTPMEIFNQSAAMSRYDTICRFKICDSAAKAVEMINLHKLGYELLPSNLHRSPEIWEALQPNMSYKEILDILLILSDYKMLKVTDPLSKKYSFALGNMQAVAESKIHPIYIYNKMRLFDVKQRYLTVVKEAHHTANTPNLQAGEINPFVLKKLIAAFNHAFSHHPRTGVRYFVTLDLKSSYARKKVFNNRLVSCMHASVLMALSILKREKEVTVMTFSGEKDVLKPVELKSDMTFEKAIEHCEKALEPKTKGDLSLPIKTALAGKKKIDVFITIVDSVIRVNPKATPPIQAMTEYKKTMNLKMSKYVVINLHRHQADLKFENTNVKGILEMSGFTPETPKIIEAFAKNLFT